MKRKQTAFDKVDSGKGNVSSEPRLVIEDRKLASPTIMFLGEHRIMG